MRTDCYNIVSTICGENWENSPSMDERDGGYGVAMMLAFMKGVRPNLHDLSNSIEVEIDYLEVAYHRMQLNGMFLARNKWRNDPILTGNVRYEGWEDDNARAWAHVAALSSGFAGKGSLREDFIEREKLV